MIPQNPEFHAAMNRLLSAIRIALVAEGLEFSSEAFLDSFPRTFIHLDAGDPSLAELRSTVIGSAFSEAFARRTSEAVRVFFEDDSGGTNDEYYLSRLVDDFLNFAIPRCLGLPDEASRFDNLYGSLQLDLWSNTFRCEYVSVLSNVSDHGGMFRASEGVRFAWASGGLGIANTSVLRDRTVPYLEFVRAARSMGDGRELEKSGHIFTLLYEEQRQKTKGAVNEAYLRSEEITRKVCLALRLVTGVAVFSDYRGFRIPGHLAPDAMMFRSWPGEHIERGDNVDLQSCSGGIARLLPLLMETPYKDIAVIDQKIDDAFRRERRPVYGRPRAEFVAVIDQLLDYFQALEAIITVEGSYQIALYAAVLLGAAGRSGEANVSDAFQFVKDMHTLRNHVIHGRIDDVLAGQVKTKNKLDLRRFGYCVRQLAMLFLLNREIGDLKTLAHRLVVGEKVALKTLYD